MATLHTEDYLQLGSAALAAISKGADKLDIPEAEAVKAYKTPHKNVKVSEKITFDNFYKNPAFWTLTATVIGSAAIGEYGSAVSAALGIFGVSF